MSNPIQRLAELHAELMQARADLRLNERACPYQCHANEREYCKDLAELLRSEALDALPQMLALARAAEEVIARWDTPLWKDVEPTAAVIGRLRSKLSALTSTPTEATAGEG
jgi:hypothetical protein